MKRAKETKLCRVYRDSVVESRDAKGRVTTRTKFLAGHEYNLPEWWYEPLREQGALTPPGGEPPPVWRSHAIHLDYHAPDGEE